MRHETLQPCRKETLDRPQASQPYHLVTAMEATGNQRDAMQQPDSVKAEPEKALQASMRVNGSAIPLPAVAMSSEKQAASPKHTR